MNLVKLEKAALRFLEAVVFYGVACLAQFAAVHVSAIAPLAKLPEIVPLLTALLLAANKYLNTHAVEAATEAVADVNATDPPVTGGV